MRDTLSRKESVSPPSLQGWGILLFATVNLFAASKLLP